DPYGPGELDDVRGAIDANGKIVAIDFTATLQPLTNSNNAFETTYEMAGGGTVKTGTGGANTSITNGPQYVIPNRRVTSKSIPFGSAPLLKTAQLRAPGDIQATFGLAQMNDPRWTEILNQTAKVAAWQPKIAASKLTDANVVSGRGVALAPRSGSLSAVIADVEVNKKTGKILVKHMYASQDAGLTIS